MLISFGENNYWQMKSQPDYFIYFLFIFTVFPAFTFNYSVQHTTYLSKSQIILVKHFKKTIHEFSLEISG